MTEINNRIEEVKELLVDFHNCPEGKERELLDPFARQICQLFPQPLTDEAILNEVAVVICETGLNALLADKVAEQILALLPDNHLICKAKLAVAVKQERERIANKAKFTIHTSGGTVIIDKDDWARFLQTLKGG